MMHRIKFASLLAFSIALLGAIFAPLTASAVCNATTIARTYGFRFDGFVTPEHAPIKVSAFYPEAVAGEISFTATSDNLSRLYRNLGKYELWLEEWRKGATLNNDPDDLSICEEVTLVYAKSGFRIAQTRNVELLKRLAQRRYVDPAVIAYESAHLGDKEQVFFWLARAYSEKSGALQFIKMAKSLDPFRSDPRYIDLIKRMGLPL